MTGPQPPGGLARDRNAGSGTEPCPVTDAASVQQFLQRSKRLTGSLAWLERHAGGICVLTPVEYPDADAVAVYVEQTSTGEYFVSDMSGADQRLIGSLNARAAANRARGITSRYDTRFVHGSVTALAPEEGVPDACWRVAQASAAVADIATHEGPQVLAQRPFDDIVASLLTERTADIRSNAITSFGAFRATRTARASSCQVQKPC